MKILFIRSLNPFYETGASANRFVGLLKGLLEKNVQVTMVVTGGYNNPQEYKLGGKVKQYPNLEVHYTTTLFNYNVWLRRINKFVLNRFIKIINTSRLKSFFKGEFDYVWLTKDEDILFAFNQYANLIKGKTLIELNEFNDVHRGQGTTGNKLQMQRAIASEKIFNQSVGEIDCFAVMTKTLIAHYSKMAKNDAKFLHLPMTVETERFKNISNTIQYKKPYVAFTGTFNNAKDGVDVLIKAFAKVVNKYPDLNLYLAGFYHYDVDIQKKLIADYGLNDRITYLGILDKEQIPAFVCNATVLVLSRPDSHQAQGGFPTKLGEYLATGNPVCVTKVGEIPNYLEDGVSAFMAIPGNVDSFADAMDRALSNPEEAKKVGANGKKVAETNFSTDVQTKRLVEFLKANK